MGGCVLSKATEKAGGREGRKTGANNPVRRTDSTTGNGDLCLTSLLPPPFSPAVFSRGGSWVTHYAAPFSLFPFPFIVCWRQPPSFSGCGGGKRGVRMLRSSAERGERRPTNGIPGSIVCGRRQNGCGRKQCGRESFLLALSSIHPQIYFFGKRGSAIWSNHKNFFDGSVCR